MSGVDDEVRLERLIVDRYARGDSNIALAAEFGLSRRHINRILSMHGVKRRRNPDEFNLSAELREQVVAAHALGVSTAAVERLLAVDRSVVARVWRSEGLAPHRRGWQAPELAPSPPGSMSSLPTTRGRGEAARDAWIATQYVDGLTLTQIAEQMGMSRATVAKVLREQGVPVRPATRPQKLSQREQEGVVAGYAGGKSLAGLAGEFGVSSATVYEVLKRHGVPGRSGSFDTRKLDFVTERSVAARYAAGETVEVLAAEFGVSVRTVLSVVRRCGVEVRGPGRPGRPVTVAEAAQITTRYVSGEPVARIAAEFGIARGRVTQIAVDGGAAPRRIRRAKGSVKRRKPRTS